MKTTGLRIRHLLAAVVAAACAACAPIPAGTPLQSSASAEAPSVAAGDSWTYSVRDGYTRLPRGTLEYRVSTVQGDNVTLEVRHEERQSIELYTRDWNWRERPITNQPNFRYQPAYPAFAFPLAPGKRWHARVTATDPADGRRFPVWIDGIVLGWERVRVPAGEFDALKIKRAVYFDYWELGVRGQSQILEYEWYAPAVKQSVRREASSQYLSYLSGSGGEIGGPRFIQAAGGSGNGGVPRLVRGDWLIHELVSSSVR